MGSYSIDVFTLRTKVFQTQRWQFVPFSKGSNVKTFYDCGDLENKAKIKPMILPTTLTNFLNSDVIFYNQWMQSTFYTYDWNWRHASLHKKKIGLEQESSMGMKAVPTPHITASS